MGRMSELKLSQKEEIRKPDAIQLFTDREDPQEAFERKLRAITTYREDAFGVMCYYGIGGVGKTSLKNKLCRVMDNKKNDDPLSARILFKDMDCYHVSYDFGEKGASTDKFYIIYRLKRQLEELGFEFFLTNAALAAYAKKGSSDFESDISVKNILETNPWLKAGMQVLGKVPPAQWAQKVIKAAVKAQEMLDKYLNEKRYEAELTKIGKYQSAELCDEMHRWFIMDMRANMIRVKKPLVIFLDTYEKFVESMYNSEANLIDDYWLHKGEDSVIQSIPGILWVILGREKLSWDRMDPFWKEELPERPLSEMSETQKEELAECLLEQHLLGDLSREDAADYLRRAGIFSSALIDGLYKLTHGTPFYLDICVRQFCTIIADHEPTLVDFGKDAEELVKRYLAGLSAEDREMAFYLSALGVWSDDMAQEVSELVTVLRYFTKQNYRKFVEHSCVIRTNEGTYYLHDTIRSACAAQVDDEFWEDIVEGSNQWVRGKLATMNALEYLNYAIRYVQNLFGEGADYAKIRGEMSFLMDLMAGIINVHGDYKGAYRFALEMQNQALTYHEKDRRILTIVMLFMAEALQYMGFYQTGWDMVRRVTPEDWEGDLPLEIHFRELIADYHMALGRYEAGVEEQEKVCHLQAGSENKILFWQSMVKLGRNCMRTGELERSCDLLQQAYDAQAAALGEESEECLYTITNLALTYTQLMEYDKALDMYRKAYESQKKYGEDHPFTIQTLDNIAMVYHEQREFEQCLALTKEVYKKRVEILGEDHPQTLNTLNNLGCALIGQGELEEGTRISLEVYEKSLEIYGEDHPDTVHRINNIFLNYTRLENLEEAISWGRRLLEKQKKIVGEKAEQTLDSMHKMMDVLYFHKDYAESAALGQEAFEIQKELQGPYSEELLKLARRISYDYWELQEYSSALQWSIEYGEQALNVYGDSHPETMQAIYNTAITFLEVEEYDRARELFEALVQEAPLVLGEDHQITRESIRLLKELCPES